MSEEKTKTEDPWLTAALKEKRRPGEKTQAFKTRAKTAALRATGRRESMFGMMARLASRSAQSAGTAKDEASTKTSPSSSGDAGPATGKDSNS